MNGNWRPKKKRGLVKLAWFSVFVFIITVLVVIFPRGSGGPADKAGLEPGGATPAAPDTGARQDPGTTEVSVRPEPAAGLVPAASGTARAVRDSLYGTLIPVRLLMTGNLTKTLKNNGAMRKLAGTLGLPRLADILGVHLMRPLVWNLNPTSQVLSGDTCRFVFRAVGPAERTSRPDEPDLIEIKALRYSSGRLNRCLRMYYFKPAGWRYGAFFHADGTGVERRLENPPLAEYIQITSPYHAQRGRLKHEGVDFKVPVGTPLFAPFDGVVSRVNWRYKGNGYCLEIALDRQPYHILMLHLQKSLVRPGERVRTGQKVALSGNTGRSLAPHLHYQVNRTGRGPSMDPFTFHQTRAIILPEADRAAFSETVRHYDQLMECNGNDHGRRAAP